MVWILLLNFQKNLAALYYQKFLLFLQTAKCRKITLFWKKLKNKVHFSGPNIVQNSKKSPFLLQNFCFPWINFLQDILLSLTKSQALASSCKTMVFARSSKIDLQDLVRSLTKSGLSKNSVSSSRHKKKRFQVHFKITFI